MIATIRDAVLEHLTENLPIYRYTHSVKTARVPNITLRYKSEPGIVGILHFHDNGIVLVGPSINYKAPIITYEDPNMLETLTNLIKTLPQ
jgi:hypothetical protein